MSCSSQAPSLATTLTSSQTSSAITTPHGPHPPASPASPATASLSRTASSPSWPCLPLATSSPTVALASVMVVASSVHAPEAEFAQLALVESDWRQTKAKALGGPKVATAPASQQQQGQQQPPPRQQQPLCTAPPSPPSSSSDNDASAIHIHTHGHDHIRTQQAQRPKQALAANRDAPLPPIRRTVKSRIRRKPLPRLQPPAPPAPVRAPTPPPTPPQPAPPPPTRQSTEKLVHLRRVAHLDTDPNAVKIWTETGRCLIAPIGSCPQQTSGSPYCNVHSCQALLADSTMCGGPVWNPAERRICNQGYHDENARRDGVVELITRRVAYEAERSALREQEWAAHRDFFEERFGEVVASPHAYKFDSGVTPPATEYGPRANYERMWGAHADDKWWVGEWRLHSTSMGVRR